MSNEKRDSQNIRINNNNLYHESNKHSKDRKSKLWQNFNALIGEDDITPKNGEELKLII